LATCVAVLCLASVVVFMFFDGRSHSVSDTIRPFLITRGSAWLLFVLAWRTTVSPRK
jgi:hypothetical protein